MSQINYQEILPTPASFAELIENLTGIPTVAQEGAAVKWDKQKATTAAVYFEKTASLFQVICLCDIALASSAGAALCQIPAEAAAKAARSTKLSEEALENFREVLNVATSTFAQPVKLEKVYTPDTPPPAELLEALNRPLAQQSFSVEIAKYPKGSLSLVVIAGPTESPTQADRAAEPSATSVKPPSSQGSLPPMEAGGGLPPMEAGGGLPPMEAGGGLPPMEAGGGLPPMEAGGGLPPMEAGPPAVDPAALLADKSTGSLLDAAPAPVAASDPFADLYGNDPAPSAEDPKKPGTDILMVDDMANVAKKFRTLIPRNTTLNSFETAEAATAACNKQRFRVIIIDTVMPGVDTNSLVAELRNLQPSATFIALVMRNVNGAETAKAGGFDGWLVKPFDPAQIEQILTKLYANQELKTCEVRGNVLRVLAQAGPISDQMFYAQLEKTTLRAIDDTAAACHESFFFNLTSAPISNHLAKAVAAAKNYCKEMGIQLRVVGSMQVSWCLKQSPATAVLPVYSTIFEAEKAGATATPGSDTDGGTPPGMQQWQGPISRQGSASPTPSGPGQPVSNPTDQIAETLRSILLKRVETNELVLPTMPQTAIQVQDLLGKPTPDLKKISALLEQDPVLALQIMRVANSAMYSGHKQFEDIKQAVLRLGTKNLKEVLYAASANKVFSSTNKRISTFLQKTWDHCTTVAKLAQKLCEHIGNPLAEEAFLAGMLHDIGKPVVLTYLLQAEKDLRKQRKSKWLSESQWLTIVEDIHHPVSTAIVEQWELATPVQQAVSCYRAYLEEDVSSLSNILCLSNALTKRQGAYVGTISEESVGEIIETGHRLLNLDPTQTQALLEQIINA